MTSPLKAFFVLFFSLGLTFVARGCSQAMRVLLVVLAVLGAARACNNDGRCDVDTESCVTCPNDCPTRLDGALCCGGATGCSGSACAGLAPCQLQAQCGLFPPPAQSDCRDGNPCTLDLCTDQGCANPPLCNSTTVCHDAVCQVNSVTRVASCEQRYDYEMCPPVGVPDTPFMVRDVAQQLYYVAANDDVFGAPHEFVWRLDGLSGSGSAQPPASPPASGYAAHHSPPPVAHARRFVTPSASNAAPAASLSPLLPGEQLSLNTSGWLRYTPPPSFIGSRTFTYRIFPRSGASEVVSQSTAVTIFVVDGTVSTTALPTTTTTAAGTTTPPAAPVGACCNPQGTDANNQPLVCMDDCTQAVCAFAGGVWRGDATTCAQALCAPPPTTTAPANVTGAPFVPQPHDLLECDTVWSPVCAPDTSAGCAYGYADDWTCAPRVDTECQRIEWRRKLAKMWAAYFKGASRTKFLFEGLVGNLCGRECRR